MKKIIPLIFSLFISHFLFSQANGGWGNCEFTTVAAMNAFDPSTSNYACKKVFVQATDEHYHWDGTAWVKDGTGDDIENIYNTNDTLSAERTITMNGNDLNFDGSAGGNLYIGGLSNPITSNTPRLTILGNGDSNYKGFTLLTTTTNNTNNGGAWFGARKNNALETFAAFGTWDNGTNRTVYLGGGGWSAPDATKLYLYLADLYDETNNGADLLWDITNATSNFKNDIRFQKYGAGTNTGTENYLLGVNASGNVLEVDPNDYLASSVNIYNKDSTLTSNRTITMDGNDLTFDGTSDVIIQADGDVGIGTVTPAEKLEVAGTAKIQNNLYTQDGKHIVSTPWYNYRQVPAGEYLVLSTPIVHNEGNMFRLDIEFYDYDGPDKSATIVCTGYAYTGSTLIRVDCNTIGTKLPVYITKEVRADQSNQNVVVVYIGNTSSDFYYPQATVRYSGWIAKDPTDFKWSYQSAPAPAGNYNNSFVEDYSGVSYFNAGDVAIGGTTATDARLDVSKEKTDAAATIARAVRVQSTVSGNANNNYGVYSYAGPTGTGTTFNNYASFSDAQIAANASTTHNYGSYNRGYAIGTVSSNNYGNYSTALVVDGASVVNNIGGRFVSDTRLGATVTNSYGILSTSRPLGILTGSNFGVYSSAYPTDGQTIVGSNYSGYFHGSVPANGTVTVNNMAAYANADIFGTVTGSNFGVYGISRARDGGTVTGSNYGGFFHTGHINGTVTGSNFGVYVYSPPDEDSSVGANYAAYINADNRGTINGHNFGVYSLARIREGGTITSDNYAGYFHNGNTGITTGRILGNSFGVRIITNSSGVLGTTWGLYQTGDASTNNYFQNNVGINATPTANLTVNGTANKTGGGTWAVYSDARSKENVKNYNRGLKELIQLRPVSFNYKKEFGWETDTQVGLIAQEVEKVVPSMVSEIEVGDMKDFKSVDPNEIIYMLVNSVKELKKENEKLKERLDKLEIK